MSIASTIITKHLRTTHEGHQLSILIPSWNNFAYLRLCIESLRKNSSLKNQIIVHVNEGSDGSTVWLEQQPDIDYTWSDKNIGVCYGLNMAATLAHTDYIVFMNDDMYACPGWDAVLMEEIRSVGHDYFFFSSTMIEPYQSDNACALFSNFGTDVTSFNESLLLKEYLGLQKADWSGATWPPNIVHKNVWQAVGGYSTEFHPGMYSDPDFSMKLWNLGIRLFKGLGNSKVYHFSGRTTGRVKKNAGYYKFIQKWGMTSGYAMKHYLQRGQPFKGPVPEQAPSRVFALKNLFKRIAASFKASLP